MFDDKYCLAQYWNANDCIATFAHLYISLIFPNLIYLIFAASLVRREWRILLLIIERRNYIILYC